MDARHGIKYLAGLAGIILLLALGCSTQGIQTSADSKSLAADQTIAGQWPSQPSQNGGETELFAGDLTKEAPLSPPSLSGEERVTDEIMIARAEASDAGRGFEDEMRREHMRAVASGLEDVFFAFDSWTIGQKGQLALSTNAEWLKADPDRKLTIEGHCDERGTQAYNLVLGERRAKAVTNYLVELGVNARQLVITSYGKLRPQCHELEESCFQKNRRVHMLLGDGDNPLLVGWAAPAR